MPKLDELIRGSAAARNQMLDLEDGTDAEIAHYEGQFRRLRERGCRERAPVPPPT